LAAVVFCLKGGLYRKNNINLLKIGHIFLQNFMCFLAMLNANIQAQNNDADMWANRGDYWIKKINPIPQYKAKKRRMIHKPLVLSGHGIRLNIDRSTLLIKCGFTHYPQAKEEYRFFPKDRQLPSRIVILDGDGSITFDALEWLSEQNVPLVQINWKGEIASVGGSNYASNHELSEYQLKVKNSNKGLEYAKWLIKRKIEYCRSTILYLSGDEDAVRQTLELLDKQIKTLKKAEGISDILSAEGMAAFYYFRSWQSIQLRWRGVGKKTNTARMV
jgi:CRISPR-associated protein Cas1